MCQVASLKLVQTWLTFQEGVRLCPDISQRQVFDLQGISRKDDRRLKAVLQLTYITGKRMRTQRVDDSLTNGGARSAMSPRRVGNKVPRERLDVSAAPSPKRRRPAAAVGVLGWTLCLRSVLPKLRQS